MSLGISQRVLVSHEQVRSERRVRGRRIPAWTTVTVAVFCALELCLFAYMRATSGMAHLRAVQDLGDISAPAAIAVCREGIAAVDDFGPALPLLNVGRLLPVASARAWGEVPRVVDAARQACPPLMLYAALAPWPERSIQDGAGADVLENVRDERRRLELARQQLASAWDAIGSIDVQALAGDSRLARIARVISAARNQQADVADAMTVTSPDHLEKLLGGDGARSIVLSVSNGDAASQAYAVVLDGRVVRVDVGEPSIAPVAVVSMDRDGLDTIAGKLSKLHIPTGTADAEAARAVLQEVVRVSLSSDENVLSALRHSADAHQAWLWFEDPALQELASRRGWVRS